MIDQLSTHPFMLGWNAEQEAIDKRNPRIAANRVAAPAFDLDAPVPDSFTLAKYHLIGKDQGQVGTCYANAGCSAFETQTAAEAACGASWDVVPLSRQFIAYWAAKLSGGGNPADGGTISATYAAMSDPPDGYGACHEAVWPYKPDRHALATKPTVEATTDANTNRLHQVASVPWEKKTIQASIMANHVPEIGISWPANWDQQGATFIDRVGMIVGGHAQFVMGWYTDPQGKFWWLLGNSHGPIYTPASVSIPNYSGPALPYCYFASEDALGNLMSRNSAECQIAAGMNGFRTEPAWKYHDAS